METKFVLNTYNDTMYKIRDCGIDLNNPMYPVFDSFEKMKHWRLGQKLKEIKRVQKQLNRLEEDFLILMDMKESDLDEFTRDGK